MSLRLHRFSTVDVFEDAALPFLLAKEAEHNLFIAICGQIREGRYTEFYLCTVEDDREIKAAAFRTPPFQLTLSCVADPAAVNLIARDAYEVYGAMSGAGGPKDAARSFAEEWQRLSGQKPALAMQQRIYQATTAAAPATVPGEVRDATSDDRDLLIAWFRAFHDEVGGIMGDIEQNVDLRLRGGTGGLVVWCDDGAVVSMAGFGGPTRSGIRVGPVYTPNELRGRGYASACVGHLTRRLLDDGRRFVFLYTDLANPTSNSIYQKIGYRPVLDVDQYRFD